MSDTGPVGRPWAVIDPDVVERAAMIGCTNDEIAAVVGVVESTLSKHMKINPAIQAAITHGRALGRSTLRRMQWQEATKGNTTMLIWLGKQMLGQMDKTTTDISVGVRKSPEQYSDAELDAIEGFRLGDDREETAPARAH